MNSNAVYNTLRTNSAEARNIFELTQHNNNYHNGTSNWQMPMCICRSVIDLNQMTLLEHYQSCPTSKSQYRLSRHQYMEAVTPAACLSCVKPSGNVDEYRKYNGFVPK